MIQDTFVLLGPGHAVLAVVQVDSPVNVVVEGNLQPPSTIRFRV